MPDSDAEKTWDAEIMRRLSDRLGHREARRP